eukprot:TRINITY_DN22387_c0_g1_i1.p1 TRINITY_DN22387_c0_g1~~TRINITY_DN22387_c0_g1_i1.p1  ORF type:complete len:541 (+),score=35.88 TRINITY_DN22387_c0_g1_i1:27-1649(+)
MDGDLTRSSRSVVPEIPTCRVAWQQSPVQSTCSRQSHPPPHSGGPCFFSMTYSSTFKASFVCSVFVYANLVILGIGEQSGNDNIRISLRWLSYSVAYSYATTMAILDLRRLTEFGWTETQKYWYQIFPGRSWRMVLQSDRNSTKSFIFVYSFIILSVNAVLICTPAGEHGHMGFLFIFGLTHLVYIAAYDLLSPRYMTPLDSEFAIKSGPPSLGVSLLGLFVAVAISTLLNNMFPNWIVCFYPFIVFAYETIGAHLVGGFYMRVFVAKEVWRKYPGVPMNMFVSAVIALLHVLSESLRLTLMVQAGVSMPESTAWIPGLAFTFVINVANRCGFLLKVVNILSWGRVQPNNVQRVLNAAKYQGGYPRFFGVGAIVAARVTLGNAPAPNCTVVWVVIWHFLLEIIEDLTTHFMTSMDVAPKIRVVLSSDDERYAEARKRVERRPQEGHDAESLYVLVEQEQRLLFLAENFARDFSHLLADLPYWAHFTLCIVCQFHIVLFLLFVCGGVPGFLGFCNETTQEGLSPGILWWPKMQAGDPCSSR